MSMKDQPVANRYLDFIEKDQFYEQHIRKVAASRPTVDTTRPETSPRFQVAEKRNNDHRKMLKERMVKTSRRPNVEPTFSSSAVTPRTESSSYIKSTIKIPQLHKFKSTEVVDLFSMKPGQFSESGSRQSAPRSRKQNILIGYNETKFVDIQSNYSSSSFRSSDSATPTSREKKPTVLKDKDQKYYSHTDYQVESSTRSSRNTFQQNPSFAEYPESSTTENANLRPSFKAESSFSSKKVDLEPPLQDADSPNEEEIKNAVTGSSKSKPSSKKEESIEFNDDFEMKDDFEAKSNSEIKDDFEMKDDFEFDQEVKDIPRKTDTKPPSDDDFVDDFDGDDDNNNGKLNIVDAFNDTFDL